MLNFKNGPSNNGSDFARRRVLLQALTGGVVAKSMTSLNALANGKTTPLMPTLFVGHGDPINVISNNQFTKDWERIGAELPRPTAILTVSAHWESDKSLVQVSAKPKQIYDFYGFPDNMYQLSYQAPGAPEIAAKIPELVSSVDIETTEEWGLDHGAWCVLGKMFPSATTPVFQLSINRNLSLQQHFDLAAELSVLRKRGVLIVGSGNVVHNMHAWRNDLQSGKGEILHDWAIEFDTVVSSIIQSGDYKRLADFNNLGAAASQSHPSIEHYLPLLYTLGGGQTSSSASFFAEGFEGGSFSMRSVLLS